MKEKWNFESISTDVSFNKCVTEYRKIKKQEIKMLAQNLHDDDQAIDMLAENIAMYKGMLIWMQYVEKQNFPFEKVLEWAGIFKDDEDYELIRNRFLKDRKED